MDAFYEQVESDVFASSHSTAGPWGPDSQHAGPPSALMVREVERTAGDDAKRIASVTVDILRPVPIAPIRVTTDLLRPGGKVEFWRAEMRAEDSLVMSAHLWRVRETPADVPSTPPLPVTQRPGTPASDDLNLPGAYVDGYISAMDWSFESGGFDRFGPARAWVRQRIPLVTGEPPTPWQRTVLAVDSGSGISMAHTPQRFPAINCDLAVRLHRELDGEWVGLDAATAMEPDAGALATTRLFDRTGTIGGAFQSLFVDRVTSPSEEHP